jgi:hypothetical protein
MIPPLLTELSQAVFSMDLMHDEKLVGMKSQYAVTMVLVAVSTYVAAVGLIALVDRRLITRLKARFMPHLMARLSRILPAYLLPEKGITPSNMPTEIGETEWKMHDQPGPWSGFLAAPAPNPRQRRKKKKGKAVAVDNSEASPGL